MATPAFVNHGAQFGVEDVRGELVTADNDFRSLTVTFTPNIETNKQRSSGTRWVNSVYKTKEYSDGSAEGVPCWNEVGGVFSWAAGDPVVTDNGDGTTTEEWIIKGDDHGQTRTIQYGDRTTGLGATLRGCYLRSFDMSFGRNSGDSTLSASLGGAFFEDQTTLDTITVSKDVRPITAEHVAVYLDNDLASIGTTLLPDALSVSLSTGDIRDMVWTLDYNYRSYSDLVDLPMESSAIELKVKANAAGRALLEDLRNGEKRFMRVEAIGDEVGEGSGVFEKMWLDFCVSAENHSREDDNNVYAVSSSMVITEDGPTGFSHKFSLTTATV
jgi:hypothetical protein